MIRKAIYFIDIDETLFRTYAKIGIMKNGILIRALNNREYNSYCLKDGESYDFDHFMDGAFFKESSEPIDEVINIINRIHETVKTSQHCRMILLTARSDFHDKKPFLEKFREHGIDIDNMYIERAGNLVIGSAQGKQIIVRRYLTDTTYTHAKMVDDHHGNLDMFLELQPEFTNTKFSAWVVEPTGITKRYS